MLISIIIPIFNVEQYVIKCLKSIEEQSFHDYEVVLVDDLGADNSMVIVQDYIKSSPILPKVKILHHKRNRGLSAARNTGLKNAVGKYIFFLDSDDSISADCLEKFVNVAEETSADVVVGDLNIIGDSTNIPTLKSGLSVIEGRENVIKSYINGQWYVMAWNKLLRRDFLDKYNITFIEGLIHEDNPWSLKIAMCANRVAFVNDKTYNYLVRENSLQTDKSYKRHFDAYMRILKEYAKLISGFNTSFSLDGQMELIGWFEFQKALFFGQTISSGTNEQTHVMYDLIRTLLPLRRYTKDDIHYQLPSFIGYYLYKHFYRYKFC